MRRRIVSLSAACAAVLVLSGCAAESVYAPDEEIAVAQARFTPSGPSTVTLITMINNRTGSGGHSALLIDGAERVLFDPAGSWHHPTVPERNDVLYGMSPQLYGFFIDYHARETYHVVEQEIEVTPEIAARLIQAVEAYGPVPSARCSLAVSSILSGTPGFESIGTALYPQRTMARFAALPGVTEELIYDDDSDDNYELLNAQARRAAALGEEPPQDL